MENGKTWSVVTQKPLNHHHTTTVSQSFFRDHPGEPVPEENFWTLWCKGIQTFEPIDIKIDMGDYIDDNTLTTQWEHYGRLYSHVIFSFLFAHLQDPTVVHFLIHKNWHFMKNITTLKSTLMIPTKFGTAIKTTKYSLMVAGALSMHIINPRWQKAAILKINKSPYCHISSTAIQFCRCTQLWTPSAVEIFNLTLAISHCLRDELSYGKCCYKSTHFTFTLSSLWWELSAHNLLPVLMEIGHFSCNLQLQSYH